MKQLLKRKARIYILPTRMGGYLNGLIFLMFLLSIGYSNNLLLIFTLVLFGLNLTWVIQTHYHLHQLRLKSIEIQDGHATEPLDVKIFWKSAPEFPWNWKLTLENQTSTSVDILAESKNQTGASVRLLKRGLYEWKHLKIATNRPFGLYRAWIYLPIELKVHAYPAKLPQVSPLNFSIDFGTGLESSLRAGSHDVWNLKPHQGEESRRISWKHYARLGDLVVKEGEDLVSKNIHFRLENVAPELKEHYLSEMATQMVFCHKHETPFTFQNLNHKVISGRTKKHLQDCLKELALC